MNNINENGAQDHHNPERQLLEENHHKKEVSIDDTTTGSGVKDFVWFTEYQNRKAEHREFIQDTEYTRKLYKGYRYQIYPKHFSFDPTEDRPDEPIRRDDLLIDFDDADDPARALAEVILVIIHMRDVFNVPEEAWSAWVSGGKGFHLRLSARWLGLEDGFAHLPLYFKEIVREELIIPLQLMTVDLSIYNMQSGKPFRRENILRENGKYKVPVDIEELMFDVIDDLLELSQSPRTIDHSPLVQAGGEMLLDKILLRREAVDAKLAVVAKDTRSAAHIEKTFAGMDSPPGCIDLMINDESPADPSRRDFNRIAQTLTRYCHTKGLNLEDSISLCAPFITKYQYSGSLKTEKARLENFRARWFSMKDSQFACGYARSLHIPEVGVQCNLCNVEHLSIGIVDHELDKIDGGKLSIENPGPWCEVIKDAKPNKMSTKEMIKLVISKIDGDPSISDTLSVYRDYIDASDTAKAAEIAQREGLETDRAIIYDPHQLGDMLHVAERALARGDRGRWECFMFGDVLSMVKFKAPTSAHAVDDTEAEAPEVPVVFPYDTLTLRLRLEGSFQFHERGQGKANAYRLGGKMIPPADVLNGVIKNPDSSMPRVYGLLTTPCVRRDGSYLRDQGVDPVTGMYLSGDWSRLQLRDPAEVSRDEGNIIYRRLADTILGETEFVGGTGGLNEAVAMGFMMTVPQRKGLDIAPGFNITANVQGTGKTTLAEIIHYLATGRNMPVYTLPADADEARKQMLSTLMENPAMVVYDNIEDGSTIKSPVLSRVFTSPEYTDRLLGKSRQVTVPTNTTFAFTGNNISVGSDLLRRIIECKLTCSDAKPEQRLFKNPDVMKYILGQRNTILEEMLSIIAGFIQSGCSTSELRPSGFPQWDMMVRFPIWWASGVDLIDVFNRDAEDSGERMADNALVSALRTRFKAKEFTARDVVDSAFYSEGKEQVRDIAYAIDGCSMKCDIESAQSVGAVLKSRVGKITSDGTMKVKSTRTGNVY